MRIPRASVSARCEHRIAVWTSLLTVSAIALSGCSAFANQAATSSAAPSSPTSVAAPRTEPVTPAPNPPPSTDRVLPTGEVSLAIDDRVDLGEIVVDGTGRTVYTFSNDPANEPTCYDACADTWLPILAETAPAGSIGIDTAAAEITPRRDGGNQVTYKGFPLYHYAGDKTDRDANGQGLDMFGGEWHVLTKTGKPLA